MPLLESAKKTIPEDKQASTPIFLLATAGMRLLPKDQADAILNEVRKLFNDKDKCPFLFEDDNDARIISGKAEAIYSWVTVNFVAGVFASKGSKKSFGSLDLGGASHQNAWKFNSNNSDVLSLEVAGRNYSIFSRSYLGFGQDQARERYLGFLAQRANCAESSECVVKSPCHNTADIKAVCSDCENNKVTPTKIKLYSTSFCKTDYNELKENPYAKNRCFGGNYIYELLTAGYRLGPNKKVRVTNSLNGFKLGWTMGAVLENTGILK
ncbi:hypothetical protein OS493_001550 [Desmophyllum pertusum]|uniref:Apyrase n=1 Tax=Desmophyllum pertusum TaxID=174260 RepID=A0A9W9ZHG3_9CNID|nr:hypothetical protein OS493_001550 [Desmophyllum pertusum]